MTQARKIVRAVNWRYALGELLLIVLGILIALAISDWNDRRIQRAQERALLAEVRSALRLDLASLEHALPMLEQAVTDIERLSRRLKTREPYHPEMDALFGALYGVRIIDLNTAAYETLKAQGLQSISDGELRLGIARVFDHYYERIAMGHVIDVQATLELLRPYYLEHFRDLAFLRSATPIDYGTVVDSTYFINLVDYRLALLHSNQLNAYPEAAAEIRRVLAMLDGAL